MFGECVCIKIDTKAIEVYSYVSDILIYFIYDISVCC